ncbi:MAG: histidinol-phosphate transaminase [Firmicutes bacterium HGW-Firmicutes-1]|jgi:histidinol-phosphate aminotransferase|nr:MAG: histidinol-phosphate transaminase [Firmicutes bacterium HGW-Firmicutes-1]
MIECRKEVQLLTPYVPGKPIDDVKREYGLDDVIKLASNENPLGCSEAAKAAVIKSLESPSLYPDGNCSTLRSALSLKLNIASDQLIFGCGSDEVIAIIGKTFVTQGDEAITCTPSFPQYKAAVVSMGGVMIEVPLKNHTYDLAGILDKINERTKVIFISNPNNPTGTIVTKDEQVSFMKKVPKHILVVWDEAYNEYIADDSFPNTLSIMKDYDNIILLRTFSKMYGLASLRIGYGISTKEIIGYMNRLRGPFNVTTQAQEAARASLDAQEFVNASFQLNEASKQYTYKKCQELGLPYIETFGNFIMIDCKLPSMELFNQLQQKGVIVRPGFYFGMNTYQRVTLGTIEQMERFFELVEEFIQMS